jgi:transcriptional regulator with XRE-family HTH domain
MAKSELQVETLYAALDTARQERGTTWRQVASDAGVSASTLTRMAQGKRPDVDGLTSLLDWLGMDLQDFSNKRTTVTGGTEADTTLARITALLRSDAQLTEKSARALESILMASYESLRKGEAR